MMEAQLQETDAILPVQSRQTGNAHLEMPQLQVSALTFVETEK
jgi:hypothetical protein